MVADNAVILDRSYKSLGLYTIFNDWGDSRMGAVIYSLLEGYKDPREEVYFTRVGAGNVPVRQVNVKPYAGKFLAIRGGIAIVNKANRTDYSSLGKEIGQTNRMVWMTAAETFFLRAEGALKGWNMGGKAKDLYENGVRASFEQYNLPNVESYLADAASKAVPYVDPMDITNNVKASSPYLSTITIAWQEGDKESQKLERIITQKYLAMFPNGAEAWAEWRRTGYPKVFPVVVNNSNGVISTEDGVRRVNFSRLERQSINASSVEEAVQLLKEESLDFKGDNGATRLWWDVP